MSKLTFFNNNLFISSRLRLIFENRRCFTRTEIRRRFKRRQSPGSRWTSGMLAFEPETMDASVCGKKTCVSLLKRFVLSQHAPVPLYQKQTSRRRDLGQTAADREQTEAADQQRYRQPHLSIRESVRRPIKSQNKVSSSSSSDAVSSS